MAVVPAPVIPAPAPRGLRYGLFAAAGGPVDLAPGGHGVGGGIQYEPVSCGSAALYPMECDDTPPTQTFDDGDDVVVATPFVARATYVCGSVGRTPQRMEELVRRRLANGEQNVAEAGLAQALAAAATPVAAEDAASVVSVVAALEQWLYGIGTASYGNVGFLHAPARYMAYASAAGLLVKNGAVWQTAMGTVWVAGGGYPDDGTVYISGQVTVYRSPDISVPPAAQVFDRLANQYRLIADRDYAVAFDCVAASALFAPEIPVS